MAGYKRDVAAGAAAKFEHSAIRRHIQPGYHLVAAKQIVFAGQVVDVALPAVDAVHQFGMIGRQPARAHAARFT
ncbi:hypothetical protein X773_04290 [Mesorhizobium sp. LSJC285A00]|nr:hypothetical protein X773_04290 [Mesorhizobium sp. LSJC285A00]